MSSVPELHAENLVCSRDDRHLFSGLNFSLQVGEVLSIEGQNGAGKTSLLRILCGLRLPDAGMVRWRGQAIAHLGSEYYAELAYIGHADGIKADLTPRENLLFAEAMGNAALQADIEAVLARLGLFALEDVPTRVLSAGQKRRLALARLLVCQARLWILDEPLASLDRAGIAMFLSLLEAHLTGGGLAVLTTHHRIDLAGVCVRRLNLAGA